jgi:uncharacterized protein YbgA (DUF1722 family)/uncharacterized protein YbbK (DUF523 family)
MNLRMSEKPNVVVSKCLGFAACRYNGLTVSSDVVKKMDPFVNYIPICPEVEIGLGIPRDPIRIVIKCDEHHLVQTASGKDFSDKMNQFSNAFLASLDSVQAFILKGRSPSCGLKDVKVYSEKTNSSPLGKCAGFFGKKVLDTFPQLPVEDEGRLTNFRLREHFYTQLFTLFRFKQIRSSLAMNRLIEFHSQNKLLLMAAHQQLMRKMGKIAANLEKRKTSEVITGYEKHLQQAIKSPPRISSNINVLMHALGFFSKKLNSKEKAFFLESLEKYRNRKVSLGTVLMVLKSWIIRFNEPYLKKQTFFEPYPEELMEITDSGKGRDF